MLLSHQLEFVLVAEVRDHVIHLCSKLQEARLHISVSCGLVGLLLGKVEQLTLQVKFVHSQVLVHFEALGQLLDHVLHAWLSAELVRHGGDHVLELFYFVLLDVEQVEHVVLVALQLVNLSFQALAGAFDTSGVTSHGAVADLGHPSHLSF